MKTIMTILCTALIGVCSANAPAPQFEGLSKAVNIRNLRLLSKILPEDPVIVEAGAYEGRDTVKLAQKFTKGRIFAFEPLANRFSILQNAVQHFSNVYVFNTALDITSGRKDFYICHGTHGRSPVYEFHSCLLRPKGSMAVHLMGPIEPVNCVSLADFCREQNIDKIDFLWLSTEGSELQVLHGAQHLIEQVSIVYVRTKLFPSREQITSLAALKDFMQAHGFVLASHFFWKDIHGDALFVRKNKWDILGIK